MSLDLAILCRIATYRKELGDSPEDRSEELSKDLTPLSSGACGATPFLRKGALALSHAAVVTQKVIS